MVQELLRQVETADVLESRVVLYRLRKVYLAAGKSLFNQDGFQFGPQGINPGGKTPGAAAHDNQIVNFTFRHRKLLSVEINISTIINMLIPLNFVKEKS